MKKNKLLLAIVFTLVSLTTVDNAEEINTNSTDKIICNKKYKYTVDDTKGTYSILAINKPEKKIYITEMWSSEYRGRRFELKSTIIYNSSVISPECGTAEIKIDGKVYKKGIVVFSNENISIEYTTFLNQQTEEVLEPPMHFEKNETRPKGVLLSPSAVQTIGPKILSKESELQNITCIKFPHGLNKIILIEKGYRLVREKSDKKGEYNLNFYIPHSNHKESSIRYDKNDHIVSFAFLGELKLREIEIKNTN